MRSHPVVRLRFVRAVLAAGGLTGALVGCAAPGASPAPAPEPERPAAPARDPLAAPWRVTQEPGSFAHRLQLESTLTARVDTITTVDSSLVTVAAEWTRLAGGTAPRISGLLTEYSVGSTAVPPTSPPGLTLPQPFGALDAHDRTQAVMETGAAGPCAPASAAVQALRELFVAPPARLEHGSSWTDSATYTVCRDSIALTVQSVRTYRVDGAESRDGVLVVRLDRESRVAMQGEGLQFGEPIAITAEGTGRMRLLLRPVGAAIVSGEGEARLEMRMRGRRRSQDLSQHTRIVISVPPAP